ncbi:hypothetical protein RY185_09505 [Pseudomonas aeruginosa]|uniref:hypothetical protein n=1 Tax=Pseudomonas aeruginosa TaxID=287 RepID=UPI0029330FB0|nr:hypothetical protein [Pseudomonas aeruginosa]MDV2242047.1 hypothetical protein [Pseudomonas aeruginosa]
MTKANECTCPSGDGSLRHPCPAHPAVEQAGGDERAAFEERMMENGRDISTADGEYLDPLVERDWKARAALAQPSLMPPDRGPWHAVKWDGGRRVDLSSDDFEHDVALTVSGDFVEGDKFRYAQELAAWMNAHLAQPSPARAEQAEAERPEVVAWQYRVTAGPQTGWSLWHPGKGEEFERSYTVERRPLMTVAQHERIVGELRAVIAQLRQHKNDYMDSGQETYRALQNEIREREAEIARLDGLVSGRTAERDAALAEVERLRQFERICEGLPQDAIDGGWTVQGIRCYAKRLEDQLKSALARVAELEHVLRVVVNAADHGSWPTTVMHGIEKVREVLAGSAPPVKAQPEETPGEILAAKLIETWVAKHGKPAPWSKIVEITALATNMPNDERDRLLALDDDVDAQAQHSVPEEFSFEYRHPNGECHTVTVSREQVINEMPDFLFEALCSKFCNCEPVGETNVVECCCDEYAEEFKLIAAAPGKEGV